MIATVDKLKNFIEEMSHFDPDNMQMGAKAVCELVISGQLKLQQDKKTADTIRQAFIKQMQSDNYNVHAHAIRCIADMVPKLPSQQVEHIFSKIINSIANKDLDQKKRQIYGICAGTVIHQAAQEYGPKLSELFVQSVNQLMKSEDQKTQIEVILINVISEFIRKWPRISANSRNRFDCNHLVVYLLKNVQTKSKLEIVKKSQTALGKVALILPRNILETLFEHAQFGILNFLQANCGSMDAERMKRMRNGLLCLSNVLKTHNGEIKYWAKRITQLLIKSIKSYKQNDNIDNIDLTCDIMDSSIICLSYLLKSYSRELDEFLNDPSHPLSNFVEELIDFNIQGQMSYVSLEDEAMDEEYGDGDGDDYGCYQAEGDSDEKGWKVRRAVMHYVIVLLKKDKGFKNKVNSSPEFINLLGAKLVESNSMVSEMAFQTFNNLIESISTQSNTSEDNQIQELTLMRVKSSEKNLARSIIEQINNKIQIILQSSKFSDQLKIEGNRIIYRMIQIFHQDIQSSPDLLDGLIKTLCKEVKRTQVVENRNYCLLSLRQLICRSKSFNDYEEVLKESIKLLKASNLKVISSAYKCICTFLTIFPTQMSKTTHFPELLQILKTKLKQHDADRVVKYSVIKCVGPVFEHFITSLNPADEYELISALNVKLHIEIDKAYILEQINRIPDTYRARKDNVKLYRQTLQHVANNLGSSNASLNFQVMSTTNKIMKILDNNLDNKAAEYILVKAKPIFAEYKVPQFLEILIHSFPASVKPYAESIIKSTESRFIEMIVKTKIVSQSDCIKVLKTIEREESANNISLILAKIGVSESELKSQVEQSKWGLICLGALGYIGNLASSKYLIDMILQYKNEEFKLRAANALGNIASRFESDLLSQITILAQKSGDYYIFAYTLKEYLNFKLTTSTHTPINSKLTEWLFKRSQTLFEGQSIYQLIAECVGKIAFLSNSQIPLIIKFANSQVENHKFVLANSLRFYFDRKSKELIQDQSLESYLRTTMSLIGDKSANVRCSATKSLNAIYESQFNLIKPLINNEFWVAFKNNLQFDESLVIEVDYGISKEKKDLGRPLRVESFNFIKFLIKNCTLDSQNVDDLMLISLKDMTKQTNPDLVVKRLQSIRKLCKIDFTQFISHLGLFIQKVGIQEGVLKSYQNKGAVEDERNEVYLKSILKEILLINKEAEKQNIDQIRGYITTLKTVPRFASVFDSEDLVTAELQ